MTSAEPAPMPPLEEPLGGTYAHAVSSCIMNGKSNESSSSEKPCCLSPANCVMRRKSPMRRIEPYTGTPLPRIGWRSHE